MPNAYGPALKVAVLFQVLSGMVVFSLYFPFYHAESLIFMWFASLLAFWVGVVVINCRRPKRPTRMDIFFVRWGAIILFIFVTPLVCYLVLEVKKRF
jgi:hypothetical protein